MVIGRAGGSISLSVKRNVLFLILLLTTVLFAGTLGSFRGKILKGPTADAGKKWIYVQATKRTIRRVEMSSAKITFAPELKGKNQAGKPETAVREGAEVRVTASQDDDGEWNATAVEILALAP
jgi:hypothetical protein